MFPSVSLAVWMLVLAGERSIVVEEPAEELPPPLAAAQATENEAAGAEQVVEATGWGLGGLRGRHYFFGESGTADYWRGGRQTIVALKAEPAFSHSRPDAQFLYYQEIGTGNRWAFGRMPTADGQYVVYFQPAAEKPAWVLFHLASLRWDRGDIDVGAERAAIVEPGCGREFSVLRRAP